MNSNKDMIQTHGEGMDGGVIDPFSRDMTGLADALTPQTVLLQPDDVLELQAEQERTVSHARDTGTSALFLDVLPSHV
jgi:hypothetical protein